MLTVEDVDHQEARRNMVLFAGRVGDGRTAPLTLDGNLSSRARRLTAEPGPWTWRLQPLRRAEIITLDPSGS